MAISVERLRWWLVAGAATLLLLIAGFLGYAQYRAHRFVRGLPGRLGIDVRQETNAFTYSQTVQGRTIFTIHAAKAVERKDNKVTLHDVGIVLYGAGGGGQGAQDRADRIYGKEFEYDKDAGVMRAMGEVHIDVAAPAAGDAKGKMDYAAGGGDAEPKSADPRVIHVKTSGLVFLQKLGVAATDKEIEFETGGVTGRAKGADFSSDTGELVLHADVEMSGMERGQPMVLTAAKAVLDRTKQVAVLDHAKYVAIGTGSEGRSAEADRVTVHLRQNGTAERVEAEGGVKLSDQAGGVVTGERGVVELSEDSQPQTAVLSGGVKLSDREGLREAQGQAGEGRAKFDAAGRVQRAWMTGAVHVMEKIRSTVDTPWNEREIQGEEVDLTMAAPAKTAVAAGATRTAGASPVLQEATASGAAKMRLVDERGNGAGVTTELAGEKLKAEFATDAGRAELRLVSGTGGTELRRVDGRGVENVSRGATLEARFAAGAGVANGRTVVTAGGRGAGEAVHLVSAMQQGGVEVTHRGAKDAKTGVTAEQSAKAKVASYEAAEDLLTLTGEVEVTDSEGELWADKVETKQGSGYSIATGSVKVNYRQTGAAGGQGGSAATQGAGASVHVLAARAELEREGGSATFYGAAAGAGAKGAGGLARMWQGGSQIEAPVIRLDQKQQRVEASGGKNASSEVVKAVFAEAAATGKKGSAVRVQSRKLTYLEGERRAEFAGGVKVESGDGVLHGSEAEVMLRPVQEPGQEKAKTAGTAQPVFMSGSVEEVVMTGGIEIEQPGRKATGEKLVYTAKDGMFVLTGAPGRPPKVVDAVRGSVSGESLRMHAGDNSVVVVGSGPERARTETQVKQK